MKARELVLWLAIIVLVAMAVLNHMRINMQFEMIKTMDETQVYIMELIDLKAGLWL